MSDTLFAVHIIRDDSSSQPFVRITRTIRVPSVRWEGHLGTKMDPDGVLAATAMALMVRDYGHEKLLADRGIIIKDKP